MITRTIPDSDDDAVAIVVARLPCVRMHTANANNKMAKSAKSGKALGASASVHLTFQIRGAVAVTQSQINQP